ncbi:MvdC/MvdD family ATP grasp protein [Amycolatopsis sp. PS_44_ISF1]|uniref:MvdC/MvdD family ATP grasp protein n=1 Tax=Amycolatopsis sp. PS_44_ISF1 TaxID=2974917 RepID=UPI0028DE44A2|nr:hypothetical protein [Amycolatopsis sp. PS_44_ISF1]MDT8915779.1 hypothetical protein [Amycolatopsis sp. PS_44_ISF1]MDT8916183.1 hypothetical protein [Amycolatopsis sp. PS_44_ISF1]
MTEATDPFVVMAGVRDWAVKQVGAELDKRGVRWEQLNTADFPVASRLAATLTSDAQNWRGSLRDNVNTLALDQITSIYYGKPTEFEMPAGMSGPELRFSRAQARVGLGGILASLPVRWFSHPSAIADAAYKPRQLTLFKRAGLVIPPTLITNDAQAVRAFAESVGDLIVKPLAEPIVYESGGEALVYTRRVGPAELDSLHGVELTAHLFQQWQAKSYEARVTVVGDRIFAVTIHVDSENGLVDWRSDYDSHTYNVIQVPEQVRTGILRYLKISGLAFGAFDFVIRPDESWVALEANATGAWGWLAEACDLPIASAIADELMKE